VAGSGDTTVLPDMFGKLIKSCQAHECLRHEQLFDLATDPDAHFDEDA